MVEINRESPVIFDANPTRTENRDNWTVVLEYDNEGGGPYVMDYPTFRAGIFRAAPWTALRLPV